MYALPQFSEPSFLHGWHKSRALCILSSQKSGRQETQAVPYYFITKSWFRMAPGRELTANTTRHHLCSRPCPRLPSSRRPLSTGHSSFSRRMFQSNSLPVPTGVDVIVPAALPSRCRISAQDYAEVTTEDRVPANVLLEPALLFAVPDQLQTADKAGENGMGKQRVDQVVSDFSRSYGCEYVRDIRYL